MRKYLLLAIPLAAFLVLQAPAQTDKPKGAYEVVFEIDQFDHAPDGAPGIHVKVRFGFKRDGKKVEIKDLDDDYVLVIEENGTQVKTIDLKRPIVAEDLSVMLTLDTSGSMKEHGRMKQARDAAAVFLSKLPGRADCGLILFDHEVREKLPAPAQYDRKPLLAKIKETDPRGGTAYIDAGLESVEMLRAAARGRDRAAVLMTDGIDINSKNDIKKLIADANAAKVKIYTIGIGEPGKFEQVNTVLALDHSGSMTPPADDSGDKTPKIIALHEAATRYVETMSTAGRVSIIPFSSQVTKIFPFRDKTQLVGLKKSIKSLQPEGETALFDATYDAICALEADNSIGRRAVVAMTDGYDNSSRRRVEEVIERAREAKIKLYLLGFGRPGEIDEVTMRKMAEETGGKFYHAKNKKALIEIFENLSINLHDDGIDEASLRKIAQETGGQYFPVKNVDELKLILEKVTVSFQQEPSTVYKSLNQRADGVLRSVTVKLVLKGEVQATQEGGFLRRGLVVAEMNHVVYLVLLLGIGCLIALPGLLRRSAA